MPEPNFLEIAELFQLGELDTEKPHPKTRELSRLANEDLPGAIALLKEVDGDALAILESKLSALEALSGAIGRTLNRGDRIFLGGCGATGRLSISLEVFARRGLLPGATDSNVIGFMAGGDAALIRSIERFEDRPGFGERQLEELGFGGGDLLIASTEGGETPFVIGAAEAAAKISSEPPFFLYCNPDELLRAQVERSRQVLDSPAIETIDLSVGPMALSGSTRMQASTVLMAAIGFAMKHTHTHTGMAADFARWKKWALEAINWNFLEPFIRSEAELYENGGFVIYEPGEFGITVLTDTTERSPTFTLTPFERDGENEPPSLCYLHLAGTGTYSQAWQALLDRPPRPLEWGELRPVTGADAIRKFDFSDGVVEKRRDRTPPGARHEFFRISSHSEGRTIRWEFRGMVHEIPVPEEIDILGRNLLLKMLMNVHSTLIMGRLRRYEDNLMTYVAANNFKLIDRAVRYARLLLERHHRLKPEYDEVARRVLMEKERLNPNEPIVLKTVEAFANHPA